MPGKSITLKRNSFYTGPRPHNVNEIDLKIGNSQAVSEQDVSSGKADYAAGGIPAADWKALVDHYGVNKGRVYVKPTLSVYYVAMNDERPLFKGNTALRQAVNWAIDRRALLNQEGYLAGRTTTQILPPGMPGYKNCKCYQDQRHSGATLAKAKALAKGHTGDGKAILWSLGIRRPAVLQAQIMQYNLKQIGLDVDVQTYARGVQIEKSSRPAARRSTSRTMVGVPTTPTAYDFINVLLSGDTLQASNNSNIAYFNVPKYNKAMLAASRLVGNARYAAYGALDIDITKNAAPWAAYRNASNRDYVSARTGCYTYNPVFQMDTRQSASSNAARAFPSVAPVCGATWRSPLRIESPRPCSATSSAALLWAGVLFFAVTIVTFVIFFIIPADPARLAAGQRATPDEIARARHFLGLDRPVPVQYALFLKRLVLDALARPLLHEPAGREQGRPDGRTRDRLARLRRCDPLDVDRSPDRSSLGPSGRDRVLDRGAMVFVLIGISAPVVWVGLILQYTIGFRLGWTPNAGYCDLLDTQGGCGGPVDWAYHMILPWMTFALLFVAIYVRMIRANTMDTHERGLRAHRAGQGRARVSGDTLARAAQRACSPW